SPSRIPDERLGSHSRRAVAPGCPAARRDAVEGRPRGGAPDLCEASLSARLFARSRRPARPAHHRRPTRPYPPCPRARRPPWDGHFLRDERLFHHGPAAARLDPAWADPVRLLLRP